jgi:uncharacterized membrane protein YhaH (DUF805 family)
MDWIHLFTSFEGRISRRPFWTAVIILSVIEVVVALLTEQINNDRVTAVIDLVIAYPEFAVTTKRAHDRNISTWVIGLFFAIVILFDLLLLTGWLRTDDLDSYSKLIYVLLIPVGVFALILLVDLGLRRGTIGPNRYGPDPLEARG